ncbi:hypothetical protein [Jiangella alkaliphila]|uniref:Uncharacterized protein n=1 Tax=Jiangella alkaliphila TaxID=419479 RepID=A0A1H2LR36_9ACTN|nr:hypothetical protein [Jiangella alkaliphila]SDU82806.1 hypothetical protein SAMN04488563_6462 [Jiangella alkaliphila]
MSDVQQPFEPAPPRRPSRAPIVLGLVFALAAGAGIGGAVGVNVASDDGADDLEQRLSEAEAQRDDLARQLDDARAAVDEAPADDPSPEEAPSEEPPAEEPPADEPAEEPAAEAPDGSRDHPFTVGTPVGNEDWEVVIGQPREAWAEIQDENEFNEPPPDGMEFYLLPVTATYTGDESGHAWADLTIQFVGSDSVTYSDYCGVIPGDLSDVGELYAGGVAEGNVCVVVPAGADGLWTVSTLFGEPLFLTAGTAAAGT